MARQAENMSKTPPQRPKNRIAGEEPEGRRSVAHLFGPTTWTRANLSVGAPRAGRCFPAALGRLHPDLGAKMENAPNPKQAASRHQLGQFQPHRALRGGRPVALTGPARGATSRSPARGRRVIHATQPN